MNLFVGCGANLLTQPWIAARYFWIVSLALAALSIGRRVRYCRASAACAGIAAALLVAIFARAFPDCYIEGAGLTGFKIGGEYLISPAVGRRPRPVLSQTGGL
jgi:hypothetical protein